MKRHLAFDLGAESGRAIVGTLRDGKLELEELHRFPTKAMPVHGSLRWNVYRFYEELIAALRKYAAKYGPELESIGVDTWGVDYGLLAPDGTLLETPFHYRDDRAAGAAEIIDATMGNRAVYDLTGIQFMQINTLNQMVSVKRDRPDRLEDAEGMLFIGDILHYLLSGRRIAEYTVASTSQMVNPKTKNWAPEIFEAFGIPGKMMTEIVFAGDPIAVIDPALARETGVSPKTKIVVPAVHDTASAAAAIPAEGENWAYLSSGTWCMVGVETDDAVISDDSFEMNISNSAGALGKNLFLKNVMGLWIIQQCKKAWNRADPQLDYPRIVELAVAAKPFAAFIDPDDDLFLAPEDGVEAVGAYLKKTGQSSVDLSDIGQVARIVYEGLALKFRYVTARLETATGKTVDRLYIIGGATKNALLCQFTADALGVGVTAGPAEATATGNLLLQAYGCGEVESLEEIRRIVTASNELDHYAPQSDWNEAYERFLAACSLPSGKPE